MTTVGFAGLGVMGSRMAKRLLDAGHEVHGWNRTKEKAAGLVEAGMRWADTPRAVVEHAEFTFTMLTDTKALRAVTGGDDGILAGLGPGKVYVDMSTVSPAASREIAAEVADRGASMLDAPVSGSVITLDEGKLSIMVGGDPETVARAQPVLLDIGRKVDARRRERPGRADEDRDEPQPRGADAVVQRGRPARRRRGSRGRTRSRSS